MSPILDRQVRQRELGRIRLGHKGGKGQPEKLSHFRLTSAGRHLLEHAAALWGGEVREWADAPTPGQWEVYTKTDVLPIVVPPSREPISAWYEQWTAGGCTHRCDGYRNHISDEPCSCDPDKRACKPTTRLNVMLPDLPDVGVWRLETHGVNAADELPGTIQVIQMAAEAGKFLPGRLRIEHRISKQNGTRRYIVPVLDLDVSVGQLMSGQAPVEHPALPAGGADGQAPDTSPSLEAPGAAPVEPPAPPENDDPPLTQRQRSATFARARELGVPEERVRELARQTLGHGVSEMTKSELPALGEAIKQAALSDPAPSGDPKPATWRGDPVDHDVQDPPVEVIDGQETLA